jgi:hypothetical protein
MLKEIDFGVFYTCYTEKEAIEHSLSLLYEIYPEVPVYLVSDGGSDFSYLEKNYKMLKTSVEYDSRSKIPSISDHNWENSDIRNYVKNSIWTFLSRLERAVYFCNKPYMLIMEPDVLVRGKLHLDENIVLAGSRVNFYHWAKDDINKIFKSIPGSKPITHYGCIPAIFKSEKFIEVLQYFMRNPKFIDNFCSVDSQFANYDILLGVIFSALGYVEQINPELLECYRHPNWKTSNHPLLHQFRIFYPKDNYDGRHSQ